MSPLYMVIHEKQMQMELCRCYCCWGRSCYFFCSFFLSWHLLSLNPHWNRLMMIKLMKHLFCPNSNQSVVAVALHCLDLRSTLPMPSFSRFLYFSISANKLEELGLPMVVFRQDIFLPLLGDLVLLVDCNIFSSIFVGTWHPS